jgi:hypothetical protein
MFSTQPNNLGWVKKLALERERLTEKSVSTADIKKQNKIGSKKGLIAIGGDEH